MNEPKRDPQPTDRKREGVDAMRSMLEQGEGMGDAPAFPETYVARGGKSPPPPPPAAN